MVDVVAVSAVVVTVVIFAVHEVFVVQVPAAAPFAVPAAAVFVFPDVGCFDLAVADVVSVDISVDAEFVEVAAVSGFVRQYSALFSLLMGC